MKNAPIWRVTSFLPLSKCKKSTPLSMKPVLQGVNSVSSSTLLGSLKLIEKETSSDMISCNEPVNSSHKLCFHKKIEERRLGNQE